MSSRLVAVALALLAVVALYFGRLWHVLVTLPTEASSRRFALSVIIACVPAFAAGFLLHDFIKQYLFASLTLIAAEKVTRKSLTSDDQKRLIDEALSEIDFSELEASSS